MAMNPDSYELGYIPTCEVCKWFASTQSVAKVVQEGTKVGERTLVLHGECRKHAPRGAVGMTAFPRVQSNQWCGEHEMSKSFAR